MNIPAQTAINLRDARKEAKITQTELARQLGKSQRELSFWETGKREIPLSVAVRASIILKTQIIPLPDLK